MKSISVIAASLLIASAPLGVMAQPKKDTPPASSGSSQFAPGQQDRSGSAKEFAPGQKQTDPGTAKNFAPGQQNNPSGNNPSSTKKN
jgi:hypothetical protein